MSMPTARKKGFVLCFISPKVLTARRAILPSAYVSSGTSASSTAGPRARPFLSVFAGSFCILRAASEAYCGDFGYCDGTDQLCGSSKPPWKILPMLMLW